MLNYPGSLLLRIINISTRIQGLCNYYKADLLISEDIAKRLQLPVIYQMRSVGENLLKGRDKTMELFNSQTTALDKT